MATRSLVGQRIATYVRYSAEKQNESSVEDQIRRGKEFVEAAGGVLHDHLVFVDRAISGATMERPALKKLVGLVRARAIDILVTEDVSRLSRDTGHAHEIYKVLRFAGVELLTIADGIDTTNHDAKLSFSLKSLMGDLYLEDLRYRTRRGMEGRALAGYSTGGLPYGFISTPVLGETGRPVGYRIEIEPARARVVRKIFGLHAQGVSFDRIAARLSEAAVPPPRSTDKRRRPGRVGSAIREMLLNEKYVGRWTYGKTRWLRDPETGRRRPQPAPEGEVLRQDRPELRIVDEVVWERVQARFLSRRRSGRRPARRSYLLSGLLECGVCGAPLVIHGGDRNRRYYRCSSNKSRGTCKNRASVREAICRTMIVDAIRIGLTRPEAVEYVEERAAMVRRQIQEGRGEKSREEESRLRKMEARIRELALLIGDRNDTPIVRETLFELEAEADTLRRSIAGRTEEQVEVPVLPTVEEIRAQVFQMEQLLTVDVQAGREALRGLLKGGTVRLFPGTDGVYTAECDLLPLGFLLVDPVARAALLHPW